MRIDMVCREKKLNKPPCALVLQDGRAELTAEDGSVLFSGSYHELDAAARFPSFAQSIKYFGVKRDGRVLDFDVAKADIQAIRNELDRQIIAADPAAAQSMSRKGKLLIVGGIAAIVAGLALSLLSYQAIAERGGKYHILYGLSIFGIVILGRGISLLRRSSNAKQMK